MITVHRKTMSTRVKLNRKRAKTSRSSNLTHDDDDDVDDDEEVQKYQENKEEGDNKKEKLKEKREAQKEKVDMNQQQERVQIPRVSVFSQLVRKPKHEHPGKHEQRIRGKNAANRRHRTVKYTRQMQMIAVYLPPMWFCHLPA